jgi:hypothetical protein
MSPAPRPRSPSASPEFDDVDIDVQTATRGHMVTGAHVLHHCVQVDTLQRHEEGLARLGDKVDNLILDHREVRRVIGRPTDPSTGESGTGMARILCDTKESVDKMARKLGVHLVPSQASPMISWRPTPGESPEERNWKWLGTRVGVVLGSLAIAKVLWDGLKILLRANGF